MQNKILCLITQNSTFFGRHSRRLSLIRDKWKGNLKTKKCHPERSCKRSEGSPPNYGDSSPSAQNDNIFSYFKIPFPIFAKQKWSGMTFVWFMFLLPSFAFAMEDTHKHGKNIFHKFILETDIAKDKHGTIDFDGWIGGDRDKLFLKSETEFKDGNTEKAEFWSLYSRNISEFWDMQIGLRQDIQPSSFTYFTFGVEGLAQYFFETQAHLFVSDEGHIRGRIRQENEFLLIQKIIFKPYLEANFYAQDIPQNDIGAGLSDAEFGLQTRYEISRNLAPYIDLKYERKFGETSALAQSHGEDKEDYIASVGVRVMF